MQNIKIDFLTNTIIVTKAFLEAASEVGSEEYTTLRLARIDNPNMRVATRSNGNVGRKSDSKGLTYTYMRKFIRTMDRSNIIVFEDLIAHYEEFGYSGGKLFQCVKVWFLKNYPHHRDMIADTAPKKIEKEVMCEEIAA